MVEWSVVSMAVAFVILVSVAIVVLITVRNTVLQAYVTILQLQRDTAALGRDVSVFVQDAQQTAAMVKRQVDAFEPFCHSIRETGETLRYVSSSVTSVTEALTSSAVSHVNRAHANNIERIGDMFDWMDLGLGLWEKWQAVRPANAESRAAKPNESKEGS